MSRELHLIPIHDYAEWDLSSPVYITCINHTNLRWLSKNPFCRNLHYISWHIAPECPCPFSDLMVIVQADDAMVNAQESGE